MITARRVTLAASITVVLLGASLPGQAGDLDAQVLNTAPTITSVTLDDATVTPTAGSTTAVTATIVADDLNGYNDISYVNVTIRKADDSTHIASAAATLSSGSGTSATYTYTFNMQYYDDPALTLVTDAYDVKVVVTDAAGASVDNLAALTEFTYAKLAAVGGTSAAIDFGSNLEPGDTSSAQTQGVLNHGNVQIDAQLSGTDLTLASPSATIGVANVAYSVNSDMSASSALSTSATTLSTFDLAKGSGSSKNLYYQLTVPSGSGQYVPAGSYQGTLTVAAVEG